MDDTQSSTSGRSRRQKSDKTGRLSALEKLKQLKGSKNKYEIEELENVYEEVDEKEYSKTVLERQNDDWIVDDGGSGYVEDGREIFDDDLDDESIQQARKQRISGPRKKKKDDIKKRGDIQNMLINMPSKKKADVKLDDDNILGDLMSELKKEEPVKTIESRTVRNKFCIVQQTNRNNDQQTLSQDRISILQSNTNLAEKISTNNDADNDIDNMIMFEMPKKMGVGGQEKSKSQENSILQNQSISQQITDETSNESQSAKPITSINEHIKLTSKSQTIEDACEDIGEFVGDLSNIEFESVNMDDLSNVNKNKEHVGNKSQVLYKDVEIEMKDLEIFDKAWDSNFETQVPDTDTSVDCTELPLPLINNKDGEEVFRFYWWDAYEDPYKQPGVVYLFGKVYIKSLQKYCSTCLTIKNIPRRIFLLPRKYVKKTTEDGNEELVETTTQDVYNEFNEFANNSGIKEFRCNRISKSYAFEQEGIPHTSEYLEVRYVASYPAMDSNYSGRAIEHVFGTTTNALELLLIERDIKGPCWLDIKNPLRSETQTSWCRIKVNCMKMENISVSSESQDLGIPPMVIATLNIRVSLNTKLQQNEIVMIAVLLHHKYYIDKEPPKPPFEQHFCLITHPRDAPWPRQARDILPKLTYTKIIKCDNETDLFEELLKIMNKADPDLVIGCDCGFQFDILMQRMFKLKVSNWSRVGRLRRAAPPLMKGKLNLNQVFTGRPVCDIQVSAKELNLKIRSYDLQSLCMHVLKKKENEYKEIKLGECWAFYNTIEKLQNLIKLTLTEAFYVLSIMFELNVIPLALQITCIAGNILSRTLSAGRAERNEYLLLHAFHKKNYITPDKRNVKKGKDADIDNSRRKKAAYAGGLVLEPKKGFYDKLILLMDFNSLYPSIIQEYNLCFITVPGAAYADSKDLTIPESNLEPGVIPTEIRKLVESRVEVKKLMKAPNLSPEQKMQYNIRQMALKLTANSMYGCLGATHCRFYAKGLAALITAKGREILQNTKSLVEKLNYEVIYGDTDSIMINTNVLDYDEVFSIGKKLKQEVNKLYKRVELDIDGVFRYLLLLQKKKYAAATMTKLPNGQIEIAQEHKGLDIVRRDWCQLACETGKKILDQLLSDQASDTRIEQIFSILQNVAKNVREGQVSLSSLVITKQLSKNPNEYPDKKQAHVMVALRLNKEGGRMWKVGDTVPYIICEDGTDKSATERAYHIDEFKKSDSLKIDINYYLLSQIFPIVLRICDPIEGIDDVLLAENLGLEKVYKSRRTIHEQDETNIPFLVNEERFRYCLPLKFKCRNDQCQTDIIIKDVISEFPNGNHFSLTMCPNVECNLSPWKYANAIQNEVQLAIRNSINEYYAGWLECENPLCCNKTRKLPLVFQGKYPDCEECEDTNMHRIYSETKLYNQICFYLHIFDLNQSNYKHLLSQSPRDMIFAYETLKEAVERILRRNAYSIVNLTNIFANINTSDNIADFDVDGLDISDESEDEAMNTETQSIKGI